MRERGTDAGHGEAAFGVGRPQWLRAVPYSS